MLPCLVKAYVFFPYLFVKDELGENDIEQRKVGKKSDKRWQGYIISSYPFRKPFIRVIVIANL